MPASTVTFSGDSNMYLTYADICGYTVDVADANNDDKTTSVKKKMIVVEGVPVATKYRVSESFTLLNGQPIYRLSTLTVYDANENGSLDVDGSDIAEANIDRSQAAVSNGVKKTGAMKTTIAQPFEVSLTEEVDAITRDATGSVASYWRAYDSANDSWRSYDGNADEMLVLMHTLDVPYLVITKKINELYYGQYDNPAGLLGTSATVGGATATDVDPNGYEAATQAEQTFLFKIEQSTDSGSTWSLLTYETISFASDATKSGDYYTASKVIKGQTNTQYRVSELSGWSWKFNHASTSIAKGTGDNSNLIGTVTGFDPSQTVTYGGETYSNIAEVVFTNNKKVDGKEDYEGDTSVAHNTVTYAAKVSNPTFNYGYGS